MPQPDRDEHPNGDPKVQIARLQEQLRAHRDATDSELAHRDDELKLQAAEYERRLQILNHAHEKQVQDQGTYVNKEKFESFEREIRAWHAEQLGRLGGIRNARDIWFNVIPMLIGLGGIVLAAIALLPKSK